MARKQKTTAQKAKAKATCEKRIGEARSATVQAIINAMERGGLNWHKDWKTETHINLFDQYNPITGTHYRGGNVMRLATECVDSGLDDNRWCTAWEAKKMGWTIRSEAHAGVIEKWKQFAYAEKNIDGTPKLDADGNQEYSYYYKPVSFFYVYNFSEIDGAPQLDHDDAPTVRDTDEFDKIIDALKESSRCAIVERFGDSAHYMPVIDKIEVPRRDQFETLNGAIRTYLHEMGHSTGHHSALNRDFDGKKGSRGYAYEELIAELTAVFAASYLGIDLGDDYPTHFESHAAYLKNWLKALRNDVKYLYDAAAQASKACDYIIDRLIGVHPEYERTTDTIDVPEASEPKAA